jgi:hypothetical protein
MVERDDELISGRMDKVRQLADPSLGGIQWLEAGSLALSVLHDTVGGSHPIANVLETALSDKDWQGALAASRTVVTLFDQGALESPRLAIAHEIEGDLLDIAQAQTQAAENNRDQNQKQLQLAISAFLAGAALEDALRRLCDSKSIVYDAQRTAISKLQSVLYQPAKQIEIISSSENKQITAWGDARNKADHGKFGEITYAEVLTMVIGIRAFIDKHLP